MRSSFGLAAVLSGALIASAAHAAIVPVTSAGIQGSNYDLLAGAFSDQPAADPVAGSIVTPPADSGFGGFYGTAPAIGVDFGSGFATKSFNDVYILQGGWGNANCVLDYVWSNDTVYDAGVDVAAPNINLFNYVASGIAPQARWDLQFHSDSPVIPQAQYLIGRYISGNQSNFNYEIAFVSSVPEPTSLGILALGALGLLHRRK